MAAMVAGVQLIRSVDGAAISVRVMETVVSVQTCVLQFVVMSGIQDLYERRQHLEVLPNPSASSFCACAKISYFPIIQT